MFTHIMLGSNDLDRAKDFYDATFAALGSGPGKMDARGRLIYAHEGGQLMITTPIDGNPATAANGGTIGSLPRAGTMFSPGTRLAPRMAEPRSKVRPPSARTGHSWPTCAIQTETSSMRERRQRGNSTVACVPQYGRPNPAGHAFGAWLGTLARDTAPAP